MKKSLIFIIMLIPFVIWAEDVIVPDTVQNAIDASVSSFVTKTWIMSSAVMAIIQVLKKIFSAVQVEISGIKSQALAILISIVYVLLNLNVWEDGKISPDDIVLIIQGVVSAVGGIYGYKILWRKKDIPAGEAGKETK